MKKIKLFSLVAATLFAGSAMAVALPAETFSVTTDATKLAAMTFGSDADVHYAVSGSDVIFSALDLYKSSGIKWQSSANGGTSSRTWEASAPFQGSSYYHSSTTAKCVTVKTDGKADREYTYRFTNATAVAIYGKPSNSKPLVVNVYEVVAGVVSETAAFTASSESATIQKIEGLDSEKTYVLSVTTTASSNVDVYEVAFTQAAPKSTPWMTLSPDAVSLKVSPFAATVSGKVIVEGGNLTAGTYDLTLPTVTGLTITPTSVTVAEDGTLNETIALSYTSDVNVEAASAVLALTISELTASTTINYSANVDVLTQTVVTEDITWNWANAGTADVVFTETSKPSKTDTIVLANVDGIANDANFNSQALSVRGEYMFRKEFNCFQGDYISFNVEKAGTVKVVFSNTNKREANKGLGRVLYINDVPTNDSTLNVTEVTSQPIAIPAGKVTITSKMPSQPDAYQYLRIYSIIYTMDKSGDIGSSLNQAQVEAKAVKVIRDGQLLIIRDGKTYTAQGVELQ